MTDREYNDVVADINGYADRHSYMSLCRNALDIDWLSATYMPLYLACDKDTDECAAFFRLVFWVALAARSDKWTFVGATKNCMLFEHTSKADQTKPEAQPPRSSAA